MKPPLTEEQAAKPAYLRVNLWIVSEFVQGHAGKPQLYAESVPLLSCCRPIGSAVTIEGRSLGVLQLAPGAWGLAVFAVSCDSLVIGAWDYSDSQFADRVSRLVEDADLIHRATSPKGVPS